MLYNSRGYFTLFPSAKDVQGQQQEWEPGQESCGMLASYRCPVSINLPMEMNGESIGCEQMRQDAKIKAWRFRTPERDLWEPLHNIRLAFQSLPALVMRLENLHRWKKKKKRKENHSFSSHCGCKGEVNITIPFPFFEGKCPQSCLFRPKHFKKQIKVLQSGHCLSERQWAGCVWRTSMPFSNLPPATDR